MLVTLDGVVIGRRTIGESNCFIDVLTDEYGVIEATAHGIKKISSKNSGACMLFSLSKFCFSKAGTRYTLNSAEPKMSFHGLSAEIERLSLAAYFAEVIRGTVSPEQEAQGFTRFLSITLFETEKGRIPLEQVKAVFELRAASMLGFSPDLRACRECACYEHEEMYFDHAGGNIVCGACVDDDCVDDDCVDGDTAGLIRLSPDTLYAMRHIVFSPVDKIYRFTAGDDVLKVLAPLTEKYLAEKLDCDFRSLDYYKSIVKGVK